VKPISIPKLKKVHQILIYKTFIITTPLSTINLSGSSRIFQLKIMIS